MKGTITCSWCGRNFVYEHTDPAGLMIIVPCPGCGGLLNVYVVESLCVTEHRTTERVETEAAKEKVGD